MPKIDHASQEVASEWSAIWGAKEVASEARNIDTHSALYRAVNDLLADVPRGGVVLEGGCGLGRWIFHCRGTHRILGLERSEPALRALKSYDQELRVVRGDVFQLPIQSESVDLYFSFGVLEHFQGGPAGGLREAHRVLRPGGMLFITGPGSGPLSLAYGIQGLARQPVIRRLVGKPPLRRNGQEFFQYRFSAAEMRGFLKEAGFQIQETKSWGNLETLWQYVSPLRHPATRQFRVYPEVVMSGSEERLTTAGMWLHRAVRRVAPWLFAYAWAIRAVKPAVRAT